MISKKSDDKVSIPAIIFGAAFLTVDFYITGRIVGSFKWLWITLGVIGSIITLILLILLIKWFRKRNQKY